VSILHSLLPRESKSKDVDAALIMAKGFPAFAVEDEALCSKIESNVDGELLVRNPINYCILSSTKYGNHVINNYLNQLG